jgi:hypothetical protein
VDAEVLVARPRELGNELAVTNGGMAGRLDGEAGSPGHCEALRVACEHLRAMARRPHKKMEKKGKQSGAVVVELNSGERWRKESQPNPASHLTDSSHKQHGEDEQWTAKADASWIEARSHGGEELRRRSSGGMWWRKEPARAF